jgi:heme A synthase
VHGSARLPSARLDLTLAVLLAAAAVGIVLQITMGGVVRVTGSGLGCPDWPLCHGGLVPPLDYHAWIEWTHRTTGVLVGIVVVAACARAWLRHRENRAVLWLTTATLGLIAVVGGIGGSVVLSEIHPALRTLHLGLAETNLVVAIAALAIATRGLSWRSPAGGTGTGPAAAGAARAVRPAAARQPDRAVARLAWIGAIAVLIALLSGSYAVWRGAGTICYSWPMCGGPLVPDNSLAWTHMAHRLMAGAGALIVLVAGHRAYRVPSASTALRLTSLALLVTVIAQVLIGAANPWTGFVQWARVIHLTLATLIWAEASLVAILVGSLVGPRRLD